jgi:hypothetical protein
MGDTDIQFPINYNESKIEQSCNGQAKEFGRSLLQNMANIFGMGHAASYLTGKSDLDIEMDNMQKDMEKQKWEITFNLFNNEANLLATDIQLMNQILVNLQQQSSYYSSIFDPQFEEINLLDRFRLMLLFSIIFVLIVFINWK